MKRKTLFFLLGFQLLSLHAYGFKSGGLYYNITGSNEVKVTYEKFSSNNYSGLTTVIIPETVTYNGITYSVTSIGVDAFRWCSGLTSITIPNSVTSIGSSAFYNCSGLTSITIPNSVTSIGSSAFYNCSGLTSVTIPNSVTSIGNSAFYNCSGLTSVTIPNSITSIEYNTFNGCSGLTSITIPNSVTSIGKYAFNGCSGLTSITIPNSVTSIGEYAFSGCSGLISVVWNAKQFADFSSTESSPFYDSREQITTFTFGEDLEHVPAYLCYGMNKLTSVIIPNSVTSIGEAAFSGCSSLTSVTIPEGVTSIGGGAFSACSGLTSVTIPNSVTSIGESAFSGCSGLTSITIPNSVTSIEEAAFLGCSSLTSVTIPEGVTSIGDGAFSACSGLTSVTIPNSVTSIEGAAFSGCSGLTSVTIPNSVTSIGGWAFNNCSRLTSITIPEGVTTIGNLAFLDCMNLTSVVWNAKQCADFSFQTGPFYVIREQITSFVLGNEVEYVPAYLCYGMNKLTSITIPEGVTSIGNSAFSTCTGLTSVTIPNSVTSIGNYTFCYCFGLTSVTIPNSVTSIGEYAFSGCSGLTSISIPNSVTSIGEYAFSGCSGLTSITIPNSVTSIGNSAFRGCYGLTSITIPNSVTSIGEYAFSGCSGLTSITIPNSVTTIGEGAFYDCTGLTSVTIPNSVTSIGNYAFEGCNSITSVVWDAKQCADFSSIEYSPFYDIREQITSFVLGNEVEHVPAYLCYGMNKLTSIIVPHSTTVIGESAFAECTNLESVTLGSSLQEIGCNAFYNDSRINDITCYAAVPPTCCESTFYNVSRYAYLFVPADALRKYQLAPYWRDFDIQPLTAKSTATDGSVTVIPSNTEAGFIWPSSNNADTYTLAITKDGVVFCTLTFNANGQLMGIAFAPAADGHPSSRPAAQATVGGWQFTVTGLSEGVSYAYRLTVTDATNTVLADYTGTFRTTGGTAEYTLTVQPNNEAWGSVSGGGVYTEGREVTIEAVPNEGCRFLAWHDGVTDNPRTLIVTEDATYTALFERTNDALLQVEGSAVRVYTRAHELHIEGLPSGAVYAVYNAAGKQVYNGSASVVALPHAGVYMVRFSDSTTCKTAVR